MPSPGVALNLERLRRAIGVEEGESCTVFPCLESHYQNVVLQHIRATSPGGRVVAVVPIDGSGTWSRLVRWVSGVLRTRRVEMLFRESGLVLEGRLGAFPTIADPRIIFDTRGHAGRYASANLLSEPTRGAIAVIRRLLAMMAGVPTSVGGLIVVGRRP